MTPNIPSGRRIDSKLLLKSIAPSGCIYIRLLAELLDESDDMLNYSNFSIPFNQTKASVVATAISTMMNMTLSSSSSSSTHLYYLNIMQQHIIIYGDLVYHHTIY